MAEPKLKTLAPAGAPRRVLLNSGVAPTRRVTLKGSDGRAIGPKTPASTGAVPPPPPAEEPIVEATPAVDEEALRAQQEYERQMEEYNRQMEEYNRQMAEYEAQQQAEAEAAAAAQAEAEAAAQAAAQAEAEAAAAAAAQTEDETPALVAAPTPVAGPRPVAGPKLSIKKPAGAPAAGPKLSVAKPAGAPAAGPKPSVAKPAGAPKPAIKKPAPAIGTALPAGAPPPPPPVEEAATEYAEAAPQMTEAEIEQQNAYYEKLQYEASKKPFHKKPIFYIGCGILAAMAIGGFFFVQSSKSTDEAIKAKRAAAAAVLNRAIEINSKEVFTLADAKEKGVEIKCSKEDAQLLLHVIIHHDEKDETGNLCWGPNTVGTALNACVLLGIASELDAGICDMVFATLAENATKMEPKLLDELLDRLTKTDIKNLNSKLNKLAQPLNPKEHAEVLTVIWTYKVRLATMKDKDRVMALIKTKDLDDDLLKAVCAYTFELIKRSKSQEAKDEFGKLVWETVKDDSARLDNQSIMRMLAYTCQPDALAYYKGKMEDVGNWQKYSPFFAAWQDDKIAGYLNELRSTTDDEKKINIIDTTIMRVLTQNRERSVEEAKQLLALAYDDFFANTTGLQALIEKDENRTPEEEEEYQKLMRVVALQKRVVQNIGNHCRVYYDWVDVILNEIEAECDKANSQPHRQLRNVIKKTREEVKQTELKDSGENAKKDKRMKLEE